MMSRSPASSPRSARYRRRHLSPGLHHDGESDEDSSFMSAGDDSRDHHSGSEGEDQGIDEPDFIRVRRSSPNRRGYNVSPQYANQKPYNTRSSKSPKDKRKQHQRSPQSVNTSPRQHNRSTSNERSPSALYPDLSDCSLEGNLYPTMQADHVVKRTKSPQKPAVTPKFSQPCQVKEDSSYFFGLSYEMFIVLLVVIVIFSFALNTFLKSDVRHETSNTDSIDETYLREQMVKNFTKEMFLFQDNYQNQDGKLWRILRSATKRVLSDPSPIQPAVILLVSDQRGGQTLSCLAKSFTSLVGKVTKTPTFDVDISSFVRKDSNDVKYELDTRLKAGFNHGSESLWLKDLQTLDGPAAMLLHAYCDNENAPYKHVTMVFTMLINDVNIHDLDQNSWDLVVERNLENLWSDKIGTDNLHALLSRVANNIAIVQPENSDICH